MSIISGTSHSSGDFYDYPIEQSLRFDGSSYLSKAFTGGNKLVHTVSFWVKRSILGADSPVFSAGASANTNHIYKIGFGTTDALDTWGYSPDAFNLRYSKTSNSLYRDTSSWYHVVQVVDYSNQSGNDRVKLYVNGVQVISFSTDTVNNADTNSSVSAIGNSYTYMIGRYVYASQPYFSGGYLANIQFIDGQALSASSFGETKSGVWIPKAYTGSYGTNGFRLAFNLSDFNTSGSAVSDPYGSATNLPDGYVADASGSGNHWQVN